MIARPVVALCAALVCASAGAQSTFSERIWWKSDANRLSAEVNRVLGTTSTAASPAGSGPTAKGFAFSNAPGEWPVARAATPLPLPANLERPVIDVRARVVPLSAGAAVGNFLRKVGPLATAVATVQLAADLGYTLIEGANGGPPTVTAPPHPSALQNLEYREGFNGDWTASIVPQCQEAAATLYTSFVQTSTFFSWPGGATCTLRRVNTSTGAVDFISHQVSEQRPRQGPAPTNEPADIQALQDAIANQSGWPSGSDINAALAEAVNAGEPIATETPVVSGPASTPGPVTSTVNVNNNTTVTSSTVNNHTYEGAKVTTTVVTTTVTRATDTGVELDRQVTTSEPVIPANPDAEAEPFAMPCGIAGTPPCNVAVDETGVPVPGDIKTDQADDSFEEWDNFLANIEDLVPEFPTIAWDFALPTACGVIPLPSFAPFLTEIDVCQFQPMFHQLMTVVWSLGALFGAISLFMKSSLSMN